MATWAMGDVQGCSATLIRLLDVMGVQPGRDRVILVGDVVNRGPNSLEVLRLCRDQPELLQAVLGNHDLHLLARAAGTQPAGARDTIDDVLAAPDREELLAWLRQQPLLRREGRFLLVHAGLWPTWSVAEAFELAAAAEERIRSDDQTFHRSLRAMVRDDPTQDGATRAAGVAAVMTRIRTLDGAMALHRFSGALAERPAGCQPWFDVRRSMRGSLADGDVIVTGHWAALGLVQTQDHWAIDGGCVWGRSLCAVCLDDGRRVEVDCIDPVPAHEGRRVP